MLRSNLLLFFFSSGFGLFLFLFTLRLCPSWRDVWHVVKTLGKLYLHIIKWWKINERECELQRRKQQPKREMVKKKKKKVWFYVIVCATQLFLTCEPKCSCSHFEFRFSSFLGSFENLKLMGNFMLSIGTNDCSESVLFLPFATSSVCHFSNILESSSTMKRFLCSDDQCHDRVIWFISMVSPRSHNAIHLSFFSFAIAFFRRSLATPSSSPHWDWTETE